MSHKRLAHDSAVAVGSAGEHKHWERVDLAVTEMK